MTPRSGGTRIVQAAIVVAETVVLLALWAIAVSGFWDSIPTGLAACTIAAAVTWFIYQTIRPL